MHVHLTPITHLFSVHRLQVLVAIEHVYSVVFPPTFRKWVEFFKSLISVELLALGVPPECLGVRSFHTKLWVYILSPLAIICAIVSFAVLGVVVHILRPAEESQRNASGDSAQPKPQDRETGSRSSRNSHARRLLGRGNRKSHGSRGATVTDGTRCPQLKAALLKALPPCLFVAFLSMPAVTSLAARSFLYQCFDQDSCYLEADWAVHVGEDSVGGGQSVQGLGYSNLDWATATPTWKSIRQTAWLGTFNKPSHMRIEVDDA